MTELVAIPKGDPFDPNNWIRDVHEHRIYADETLQVYAVVDWIDYLYLCQFKWSIHSFYAKDISQPRKKLYLRRTVTEFTDPDSERYVSPLTGKIVRNRHRIQRNLFLHQEVMHRSGVPQPTPKHVLVDHKDRDSLHCRRRNLVWATHKQNSNNRHRHGHHPPHE